DLRSAGQPAPPRSAPQLMCRRSGRLHASKAPLPNTQPGIHPQTSHESDLELDLPGDLNAPRRIVSTADYSERCRITHIERRHGKDCAIKDIEKLSSKRQGDTFLDGSSLTKRETFIVACLRAHTWQGDGRRAETEIRRFGESSRI